MVVGALQAEPDTGISGAFPSPGDLSLTNFQSINERVSLFRALLNSVVYTGGVILGTLIIGVLAGYALSQLRWRGRSLVLNLVLLTLIIPFQLLMIPMYVLIVRGWGLGDSYLGMILPFLVNSTAVFIFRQFFMQLPEDMLDAARVDGAGELTILTRIVLPLSRPAILTATLITFIGPWNEFLWPFLVTKQAEMQPLAVALANYISAVAASNANPFGAILAGAVVLALPPVILFIIFQRYFVESEASASLKE
ncbi:MAG: carbohydrate ABC transporter permease [Rubrobacteraceae bacterium]|nr:carbohydrate ABC transporter permease [Rubrobacteraceae bacterium]